MAEQRRSGKDAPKDEGEAKEPEEKDDEQAVAEMRERADKAIAKRAAAKAAAAGTEDDEKKKKGKRRWYHNVIDVALVAAAAYLIKVRFFSKEPEAPAPSPSASTSQTVSAAPSAPGITTRASAEVRGGAGPMFGAVETLPPGAALELLEAPANGYVKVKTPSGKTGYLPVEAVHAPTLPPPRPSAAPSVSK